jgi:hypothetical protein
VGRRLARDAWIAATAGSAASLWACSLVFPTYLEADGATVDASAEAGSQGDAGADVGGGKADGPGPAGDGAVACLQPEGGLPPDPGFVPCGNGTCQLEQQGMAYGCCVAGNNQTCVPVAECAGTVAVLFVCDETADCPSGEVCCGAQGTGAHCAPTNCSQLGARYCRCQSDCTNATESTCRVCPGGELCAMSCM